MPRTYSNAPDSAFDARTIRAKASPAELSSLSSGTFFLSDRDNRTHARP